MIISDLNVLEVVEAAEVFGGTSSLFFTKDLLANVITNNKFDAKYNVSDIFKKVGDIKVVSKVKGNSADFTFDNEAIGYNSSTEGTFNQQTIAGVGSTQNGTFTSAANK